MTRCVSFLLWVDFIVPTEPCARLHTIHYIIFSFFAVMQESLEAEGYRVRGIVYGHMEAKTMVDPRLEGL